ncbi:hypothetical protein [Sinimarinibacterium flocculans]|uniref:hypothetical protein n=1 Tax=Sinimarinibacterium flocculans TaxID=985250 RepID=UPI0024939110|nr:hypothetical protein [Sinimarinibacterium flocculans]
MRIHSDKLTPDLIRRCISEDERFDGTGAAIWKLDEHGSRSRARAFEVRAGADAGKDANGFKRRPAMGQPADPYGHNYHPYAHTHYDNWTEKAMSHAEWGFFIANMFAIDPEAKIGGYDGHEDFVRQTWGPVKFGLNGSGVAWSCAKYNGYEPWDACDWAFYYTPDNAPVGV